MWAWGERHFSIQFRELSQSLVSTKNDQPHQGQPFLPENRASSTVAKLGKSYLGPCWPGSTILASAIGTVFTAMPLGRALCLFTCTATFQPWSVSRLSALLQFSLCGWSSGKQWKVLLQTQFCFKKKKKSVKNTT